ncbi:NUDIX domain-containing protein [Streptosporangium sp. CA-135522]|uniref:NUDIX domain-containing protein n=1 Tax=Streptosporangium sp. CA-135522 TaxID=3240072 RepID=UPI003D8CE217
MKNLLARLWRLIRGPLQWRVLWLWHAKFMVGVTGVVRDDKGRVLLLRHRMWPPDRQWGCPTGYANKSEAFEDTVVREVHEETGLDVKVNRLVHIKSGYKLRVEVAYEALLTGGTLKMDSTEILEAKWFSPHDLPEGVQESHRLLIQHTQP